MKKPKPGRAWYFVDEAGDPNFYSSRGKYIVGTGGCSPVLALGFMQTSNPEPIRQAVVRLQQEIIRDPYFQGVPSLAKTARMFHAKDDVPEVRYLFFKLIAQLDIRAHIIVARKIEHMFLNYDHAKPHNFYDFVVSQLFHNVLHLHEENHIYFAKRQSRTRQAPFIAAIERGRRTFEAYCKLPTTTTFAAQAQTPVGEPCLSVTDYLIWSVYRAYTTNDMRYFNTVRDKIRLVGDIFDFDSKPKNWYNQHNPFDIKKATPLQLVPSEGHTA